MRMKRKYSMEIKNSFNDRHIPCLGRSCGLLKLKEPVFLEMCNGETVNW
jgi:hypothetical protein